MWFKKWLLYQKGSVDDVIIMALIINSCYSGVKLTYGNGNGDGNDGDDDSNENYDNDYHNDDHVVIKMYNYHD